MKFLADMGISPKSVDFLRQQGYHADHLHQLGLSRWSDSKILKKAKLENYTLLRTEK